MGIPTIDDKNPGRRQTQAFRVAGGLSTNIANDKVKPVSFLLLKNCLVDKRLGAVLKRPGSTTETLTTGLGVPLGMGEYISASSSGSIPVNRTMLVNFGGTAFWQNTANAWSAVSKSSRCSFSTTRQCQFAKIGTNMLIAGGLPAKWGGPGATIDRMGIVAPTSAITITSTSTGTGITLTTGSQYMYTYYNSTTGLESDWSPLSANTGAVSNKSIVIGIPSATAANWDRIRIYRTFDGGTIPYLVATVVSGTTAYTDTTADASLTARSAKRYDKSVPPTQAFICAKYAQCYWMVDASNPYKLVFSKPYTGSDVDVEYYPLNNYVMANEPVTGLFAAPGKLLVFHARGISMVNGFSVDDFSLQSFMPGVGTVFANSISSNGPDIVFLAEQGFVAINPSGGQPRPIGREIDLDLQPLLAGSYNSAIYVSTAWNPSLRQFVCMVTAQSAAGAPWEEAGTGITTTAVAGWDNADTLVTDTWEDVSTPSAADSTRVKIWGWSPELSSATENIWMEHTFPGILDDNAEEAFPAFLYHPQPSADSADPQQDKTFVGIWDGTEGEVRTLFRRDKNQDDSTNITAELITSRLTPGEDNQGYKFFQGLGFMNSYSDPTADGTGTLKYLIDFDDPHLRSYTGSLVNFGTDDTDLKKFPTMSGRHVHLYLSDTSQSQSKILLSEFFIHYRERMRREGR